MSFSDIRWQQRLDNDDATRQAFSTGLVEDGEGWMEMIQSRNQSSHTDHKATAVAQVERVTQRYAMLFESFGAKMESLRGA